MRIFIKHLLDKTLTIYNDFKVKKPQIIVGRERQNTEIFKYFFGFSCIFLINSSTSTRSSSTVS